MCLVPRSIAVFTLAVGQMLAAAQVAVDKSRTTFDEPCVRRDLGRWWHVKVERAADDVLQLGVASTRTDMLELGLQNISWLASEQVKAAAKLELKRRKLWKP